MSNLHEVDRQRPSEQEEIGESYKEIFTTAINILETNGQLTAKDLLIGRYQVFQHSVDYPRQEAIIVKIVAGENLAKARKVSIYVNGVGRLDVRKTGVKGQGKYRGEEFSVDSGYGENLKGWSPFSVSHGEDLNGRRSFHILAVRGYLHNIRRVSDELIPSLTLH